MRRRHQTDSWGASIVQKQRSSSLMNIQRAVKANQSSSLSNVASAPLTCAKGHWNPCEQPSVPTPLSLTNRLMARTPQHTTRQSETTTVAGRAYGTRAPKPFPSHRLLHKRADDIQTGSRRVGLREQGRRREEGAQPTEREEEEGGSCCSTGSQQIGNGKAERTELKRGDSAHTHRHTHTVH